MNFNTSLYSNGIGGISEEFGVSLQAARAGAAVFLITYAFGCELWAPWFEEYGRKPILQSSLFLVNIWTLPVAFAPNFASVIVGRALGGFSTAGGSVTLGMIAGMYESDHRQYAVAYIVFSSVGGSILGPIVGGFVEGFVEQHLHWRWTVWIQLIFGVAVQLLHLFTVLETRTTIMLNKIAQKRRKSGQDPNVYGPDEIESFLGSLHLQGVGVHMVQALPYVPDGAHRPYSVPPLRIFGCADFQVHPIFRPRVRAMGSNAYQAGLSFIPIGVGYVVAWILFIPALKRNEKARQRKPDNEHALYGSRLDLLLWLAPCLPIGLIIFAWTSFGPPIHWIGTMFGSAIIGIANYAIYMATLDYIICAYGPHSASATGGNGWARDFLAGVLTVPATPFYANIGAEKGRNLEYASTILFCISFILVIAVYVIYWKGPALRKRSPFAQSLRRGATEFEGHRLSVSNHQTSIATRPSMRYGGTSRHSSYNASHQAQTRLSSRNTSRANSPANTAANGVDRLRNVDTITSVPTHQLRQ
ncbi:hypothetical protein DL765_006890 [Monosporascus sp. GIB2]|nr:hypothetical protein DL765_006890 [Monosporascus sp. GIB2]